jgi:hypothetical protein
LTLPLANHNHRMSLNETSTLIAESRKIVEAAHSDTLEPNVLLNMILQIVTNIDKRIEIIFTTKQLYIYYESKVQFDLTICELFSKMLFQLAPGYIKVWSQ